MLFSTGAKQCLFFQRTKDPASSFGLTGQPLLGAAPLNSEGLALPGAFFCSCFPPIRPSQEEWRTTNRRCGAADEEEQLQRLQQLTGVRLLLAAASAAPEVDAALGASVDAAVQAEVVPAVDAAANAAAVDGAAVGAACDAPAAAANAPADAATAPLAAAIPPCPFLAWLRGVDDPYPHLRAEHDARAQAKALADSQKADSAAAADDDDDGNEVASRRRRRL